MMDKLRLLIVEDEPLIRAGIRSYLSGMESVEVVGECADVAEAVQSIRGRVLDVVLLDIQLPDGSGFDVVRQVGPQRMPSVVFVTAHDNYAIQAFEVNAVDYLLKPFDRSRLRESIERVQNRISNPSSLMLQLQGLLEVHDTRRPQTLVVRNGERFDFVPVDSIDWIETANNYTCLHAGPEQHLYGESLTALEQLLDPGRFLRVHRCYMVNVTGLVAVHAIAGGVFELQLRCGARIRSGRQYGERVRSLLKGRHE